MYFSEVQTTYVGICDYCLIPYDGNFRISVARKRTESFSYTAQLSSIILLNNNIDSVLILFHTLFRC